MKRLRDAVKNGLEECQPKWHCFKPSLLTIKLLNKYRLITIERQWPVLPSPGRAGAPSHRWNTKIISSGNTLDHKSSKSGQTNSSILSRSSGDINDWSIALRGFIREWGVSGQWGQKQERLWPEQNLIQNKWSTSRVPSTTLSDDAVIFCKFLQHWLEVKYVFPQFCGNGKCNK